MDDVEQADESADEDVAAASGAAVRPTGSPFGVAALAVGLAGGLGMLVTSSVGAAWAVSIGTVVVSALLAAIDLSRLPKADATGKPREHAGAMFLGMCVFWVAVFPFAFFIRKRYVRPDWSLGAVAVALFFVGAPFLRAMFVPAALPACDSVEVVDLLDRVIRGGPVGASVTSIDGHREVEYDAAADVRTGECVVHTKEGDVTVNYIVAWQDRERGMFEVRIPSPELPLCTSPDVAKVLERLIRGLPAGSQVEEITGHREVSYDAAAGRREGACDVTMGGETRTLKFAVQWQDRERGMFEVQILP